MSRPLVTVITAIVPIRWQMWLIEKNYHTGSTYRWIITEIIKMQSTAQLTIQHILASIVGIDWCDLDLDEKWFLKPELGSFYDVFKFCKRQLKNVSKCLSHVNHGFSLPTAPRSQWLAWVSFVATIIAATAAWRWHVPLLQGDYHISEWTGQRSRCSGWST